MFNLLSVVLAGAAAAAPLPTPVAAEQPEQRITLSARPFFPGSKPSSSVSQRFTFGSGPATWYVFTGKTLCESQTVSAEKPAFAGNGWRVDLKPSAAGSKTIQVAWERLWVDGKPSSGGGTRTITVGSGTPLVLDSIDGGSRLQRQEELARFSGADSPVSWRIKGEISELEKRRRQLIDGEGLGAANVRVIAVTRELDAKKQELQEHIAMSTPAALEALRNAPLKTVDGCDALSMNLQVTAETAVVSEPTETEIWLVHKDAAGVETVQRQVVRSATGNGSYVFDDIVVKTERGPITIEVYGDLGVHTRATDSGLPYLTLAVSRRYVTSGTAFSWKTKEGGTAFSQVIRADEVVAFNLLPLKDDEGVLVGHRFSVRVRTKILK